MADSHPGSVDPSFFENIQNHLESLQRTPDGAMLYGLIERGLKRFSIDNGGIAQAFITFLHSLLGRYALDSGSHPVTRMKARLLQQRLVPYLPESGVRPARPNVVFNPAPKTKTGEDGAAVKAPAVAKGAHTPAPSPKSLPAIKSPKAEHAEGTGAPVKSAPVLQTDSGTGVVPPAGTAQNAAAGVDTETGDSGKVGKLEKMFSHKISETIRRNKEIDALLRQTLNAMQKTESAEGMEMMKRMLMGGLEELIQGNEKVSDNLRGADSFMKVIHSERQHLHSTVSKLRKQNLADELTGLPNRAAFMRQLEAELGRARRYGFSLALAIMDLDGLGKINEQFGRKAGDNVLCRYATDILSLFRGYDLVARYGDDEFTALFPNTQKEGAVRALKKAQKRAAEISVSLNGKNVSLPTFCGVLTLYVPGEKPDAILKRADEALKLAKRKGGNRIVVALPAR